MIRWALRAAIDERAATLASMSGIAAALLLVLVLNGMFAGESQRIVAYLQRTPADVWVMQRGVANVHMSASLISKDVVPKVAAVPGVASVTPFLYASAFLRIRGEQPYSYIVGLRDGAGDGGPWRMVAGTDRPTPGGIVIPDVLAKRSRVGLGDTVSLLDHEFRIVGISADTYSMANSLAFVTHEDLAKLLGARNAESYMLVRAATGTSPGDLAERIRSGVPGINALTRDELVDRDYRLGIQMGADVIRIMTWLAAGVSALIVGFSIHASMLRRRRELGVAKALGVPRLGLYLAAMTHAVFLTVSGVILALAAAYLLRPAIQYAVPAVALDYPVRASIALAGAALLITVAAAALPARAVGRIDPALVFRE